MPSAGFQIASGYGILSITKRIALAPKLENRTGPQDDPDYE
jgi:hypothetical protein